MNTKSEDAKLCTGSLVVLFREVLNAGQGGLVHRIRRYWMDGGIDGWFGVWAAGGSDLSWVALI